MVYTTTLLYYIKKERSRCESRNGSSPSLLGRFILFFSPSDSASLLWLQHHLLISSLDKSNQKLYM